MYVVQQQVTKLCERCAAVSGEIAHLFSYCSSDCYLVSHSEVKWWLVQPNYNSFHKGNKPDLTRVTQETG